MGDRGSRYSSSSGYWASSMCSPVKARMWSMSGHQLRVMIRCSGVQIPSQYLGA